VIFLFYLRDHGYQVEKKNYLLEKWITKLSSIKIYNRLDEILMNLFPFNQKQLIFDRKNCVSLQTLY